MSSTLEPDIAPEMIRFQNADRLVDYADRQGAMIGFVVLLYDTYNIGGPFVRLAFPPLFSSLGTNGVSHTFTRDGDGGTTIIYLF